MCREYPLIAFLASGIVSLLRSMKRVFLVFALLAAVLAISGCSWSKLGFKQTSRQFSPKVVKYGQPVPKGGGIYKVGKPYKIADKWYYPKKDPDYEEVGIASWYGRLFHGRYTANGEVYDMDALTAAHPTLPIPSYARVTNRENGRTLVLRINDRGPYANDRIIDLSRYAAGLLGFRKKGTALVRVTYIGPAPLNGDDTYERRYLAKHFNKKRKKRRRVASKGYDRLTTGSLRRSRTRRKKRRYSPRRSYTIQTGAFHSRYNANRMRDRMSRYGKARVRHEVSKRYHTYRVLVGPFRNRKKAEQTMKRLARAGIYDAIITHK